MIAIVTSLSISNDGTKAFQKLPSKIPWRVEKYQRGIESVFQILLSAKMQHRQLLKVSWASTNPFPFSLKSGLMRCPATDWRIPPLLSAHNKIAAIECWKTNNTITYFDTFKVAFPLFDLSYDSAHHQGPVGVALASMLAYSLHN